MGVEFLEWTHDPEGQAPLSHFRFEVYHPGIGWVWQPVVSVQRDDGTWIGWVTYPDPGSYVRAQAISIEADVSDWNTPRVVPEPDLILGLSIGVCLVSAWGSHRARVLPGVRKHGQRGSLRGRLREVLRRNLRVVRDAVGRRVHRLWSYYDARR